MESKSYLLTVWNPGLKYTWYLGMTCPVTWSSTKAISLACNFDLPSYITTLLISFHLWKIFLPVCEFSSNNYTGKLNGFQCLLFGITSNSDSLFLALCACCLVDLGFRLRLMLSYREHVAMARRILRSSISSLHKPS